MCANILKDALRFVLCHVEDFVKINHGLGVCWGSIFLITASLARRVHLHMSSASAQDIIRRSAMSVLVQFMRISLTYRLIVFSRSLLGTTPRTFYTTTFVLYPMNVWLDIAPHDISVRTRPLLLYYYVGSQTSYLDQLLHGSLHYLFE
jgi:hypothetical protein